MAKQRIIGRHEEYARLDRCMEGKQAQLIVVYGRRRVGKTYLINEYFDNKFDFKITGAYDQPKEFQLKKFAGEIKRQTGKDVTLKDWDEAFEELREYLEKRPKNKKQIVFFDEMPWLENQKSGFMASFEWFWNSWASTMKNLIFIVCGSATSWMNDNIANNKGGLFNRQSATIYLEPFKLNEVEEYLNSKNIYWSRYEIAECYMIMGGIPYYLNLLTSTMSFRQNIDNLFFKNNGELKNEFEHLYKTLFKNSDSYIKVVEALSKKNSGLNREEIINITKLPGNGYLSKILKDLVLSGFVRTSSFYGNKKKDLLYQLSDYYTAFYFRYLKDNYGKDEKYWSNSVDNPNRRTWAGLTFEQLCKDHVSQIKHKLGISGVLTEESIWYTHPDEELKTDGAQIDLLIERRDHVINICEMKFSINEFVIDKAYDAILRNKIETFRRINNSNKTLQLTMITTYGIKQNKYSGIVQNQVLLDDLFHI